MASVDTSDLLSEGTRSDEEETNTNTNPDAHINNRPNFSLSFHQYLDEVAGNGSDSNSGGEPSDSEDALIWDESGLSYESEDQPNDDGGEREVVDVAGSNARVLLTAESDRSRISESLMEEEVEIIRMNASEENALDDTNDEIGLVDVAVPHEYDAHEDELTDLAKTDADMTSDPSADSSANMEEIEEEGKQYIASNEYEIEGRNEDVLSVSKREEDVETSHAEEKIVNVEHETSPIAMHSPPHLRSILSNASGQSTIQHSPASTLSQRTSTPSSMKRVRMSPLIKTTSSKRTLQTPPRISKHMEPEESLSFSKSKPHSMQKSKRPKIISPFSPRARKMRLRQHQQTGTVQQSHLASQVTWSMAPSRKVSILVNVSPHLDAPISSNDEENTLCLYPNVASDDSFGANGISSNMSLSHSPARSIRSNYSVTSQSSILNKAGPGQELILVNPGAFGEMIPTSVTVETARIVQEFSNIASEDWVRKFRFDEVCWPDVKQLIGIKKQNTNATMGDLSRAAVADVLAGKSAALFGYGTFKSGRLESMFGSIAGEGVDPLSTISGRKSIGLELGLLGLTVSKLLDQQKRENTSQMTFRVSIVEILKDDVLRDLIADPDQSSTSVGIEKSLRIRYPDSSGAIVENATEMEIVTIDNLKMAVKRAFHSRYNEKARKMVGGRGHIVATIHVFPEGQKEQKKCVKKDYEYPRIQIIDLACALTDKVEPGNATGRSKLEMNRTQNWRIAGIRKSMAGLGALLRSLVVQEANHMPQSSMYRYCTLTKLLQRTLKNDESHAIMISTVCPRKHSYERTMNTLNYMHRLLARPSKTAESPFEAPKNVDFEGYSPGGNLFSPGDCSTAHSVAHSIASTVASEAIKSEFIQAKGSKAFMKSLVTDPRQRLATLLSPKESPNGTGGSHGGVPMKEITTINEVENDANEANNFDTIMRDLEDIQGASRSHDFESLDSSIPEKSVDQSNGRISLLSDEVPSGESYDGKFDTSLKSDTEPESFKDKNLAFDEVLDQLDEIDGGYEMSSDVDNLRSEDESSVESLESLQASDASASDSVSNASEKSLSHSEDINKQNLVTGLDENETHILNLPASDEGDRLETDQVDEEFVSAKSDESNRSRGYVGEVISEITPTLPPEISQRPDPDGRTADELPVIAPRSTRRSHTGRNQVAVGEEENVEYSVFTQSVVSTLTPYDIMTRESDEDVSERSYSEHEEDYSFESEESYPRNQNSDPISEESYPREDDSSTRHSTSDIHSEEESFPRHPTTEEFRTGAQVPDFRLNQPNFRSNEISQRYDDFTDAQSRTCGPQSNHLYPCPDEDEDHEAELFDRNMKTDDTNDTSLGHPLEERIERRISTGHPSPPDLEIHSGETFEVDNVGAKLSSTPASRSNTMLFRNIHEEEGIVEPNTIDVPVSQSDAAKSSDHVLDASLADSSHRGIEPDAFYEKVINSQTLVRRNQYLNIPADQSSVEITTDENVNAGPKASPSHLQQSGSPSQEEEECNHSPNCDPTPKRFPLNTDLDRRLFDNPGSRINAPGQMSATSPFGITELKKKNVPDASPLDDGDKVSDESDFSTESNEKETYNSAPNIDDANPQIGNYGNTLSEIFDERIETASRPNSNTTDVSEDIYVNENKIDLRMRNAQKKCTGSEQKASKNPFEPRQEDKLQEHSNVIQRRKKSENHTTDISSEIQVNPNSNSDELGPNASSKVTNKKTIFERTVEQSNTHNQIHRHRHNPNVQNGPVSQNSDQSSSLSSRGNQDIPVSKDFIEFVRLGEHVHAKVDEIVEMESNPIVGREQSSYSEVNQDKQEEESKISPTESDPVEEVAQMNHSRDSSDIPKGTTSEISELEVEKYFESPTRLRKQFAVSKLQSLVTESNALRIYSPDKKKPDARQSLENYKQMLEEGLEALNAEMEDCSNGELPVHSGEPIYFNKIAERREEIRNEEKEESSIGHLSAYSSNYLACPASDASSSSDGVSLSFDPVPSKEKDINDFDFADDFPSSRRRGSQSRPTNEDANTTLEAALKGLQESVKHCIESTNESDLLKELAEDKLDIVKSFNSAGDSEPSSEGQRIVKTVHVLTSQTEALQTFIDTTLTQLRDSRQAVHERKLEVMETNSRLQETLGEIDFLRSSNQESINGIKQDHIDAVNDARKRAVGKYKDINEKLEAELKERIERLSELEEELAIKQKANDDLSHSLLVTKNNFEEKLRLKELSMDREISSLRGRLVAEENDKDSLEDRLTDQLNSMQALLESKNKSNEELLEAMDTMKANFERRVLSEGGEKDSLYDRISSLQQRVAQGLADKNDVETHLSKKISRLETDLSSETEAGKKLEGIIASMKIEYDELSRSHSTQMVSLRDKVKTLQDQLQGERSGRDQRESQLSRKVIGLEKSLHESKNTCRDLKQKLCEARDVEIERRESDIAERTSLNEKIRKLEEMLKDCADEKQRFEEKQSENISYLKNQLEDEMRAKTDLQSTLTLMEKDYNDRLRINNVNFQEQLSNLEILLAGERSEKEKIESSLLQELCALKTDRKIWTEANSTLKKSLDAMKKDYEGSLKLEAVEKVSLEEEIVTLQERLKEESQDKDDTEARLSISISSIKNELDDTKRANANLQKVLEATKSKCDDMENQLSSKVIEMSALNMKIESLLRRLAEEAEVSDGVKNELSEKLFLQEEEHAKNKKLLNRLSEQLRTVGQNYSHVKSDLDARNLEKESLENELTTLRERLEEEIQEREEEEQQQSCQINELKRKMMEESTINDELSEEVKSLKEELDNLKNKLTTNVFEWNGEKEAYEDKIFDMKSSLDKSKEEQEKLHRDLSTSKLENVNLKERLMIQIEKLTLDLAKRSQEKSACDSQIKEGKLALKKSAEKIERLAQDVSKQEVAYKELENMRAVELDMRCRQEEEYDELKNTLDDCRKREIDLSEAVENLNDEKLQLQRLIDDNVTEREGLEAEINTRKVENDELQKNLSLTRSRIDEVENTLASALSRNEEMEKAGTETSQLLENVRTEYEIAKENFSENISKWKNKVENLSNKLAEEQSSRHHDRTVHASEISKLSDLNETQKRRLLEELTAAKEESSILQMKVDSRDENFTKFQEGSAARISSLEELLREKELNIQRSQEKLAETENKMCSLNENLAKVSNQYTEITHVSTEKISRLTRAIKQKDKLAIDRSEDISKLAEEIKCLKQTLKDEIEKKVTREQAYSNDVSQLQEILSKKKDEIQALSNELSEHKVQITTVEENLSTEVEEKKRLKDAISSISTTTKNLKKENSDIRSNLKMFEEKLRREKKNVEKETVEKDRALSAIKDLKHLHSEDKERLQETVDNKSEEIQKLFDEKIILQESIDEKSSEIGDLRNAVIDLKALLEAENSKVKRISKEREDADQERAELFNQTKCLKELIANETKSKSSEITKLQHSLQSKVVKNKRLKEQLADVRNGNQKMRISMEKALEESRNVNADLSKTFQRTKEGLEEQVRRLEEERKDLSSRISDLSTMKETLQSENISMIQKVQEEKELREKLLKKNKSMKSTISENETQLRNQMKELESTMNETLSKVESKRKKALKQEKIKSKAAYDKLQDENDRYQIKIARLEKTLEELKSHVSLNTFENEINKVSDGSDGLRDENDRLHRRVRTLEENLLSSNRSADYSTAKRTPGHTPDQDSRRRGGAHRTPGGTPGRGSDDGGSYYYSDYHTERNRRIKAEEFAAAMAARAKAGFEKRNEEIVGLRLRISTLETEKENLNCQHDQQRQMLMMAHNGNSSDMASMTPKNISMALRQRDEALDEASRYRQIAEKLNRQVISMNQQIELVDDADDDLPFDGRGTDGESFGL